MDGSTGLPIGWNFRPQHEVTARGVKQAMDGQPGAGRVVLLDCRRDEEWAYNRIAGAVHIPMDQIERRIDEVRELAEQVEGDAEGRLVVYCHHGVRSLRVTMMLQGMGIASARSMAGGIDVWSADVDGGVPRY